jgi:hypothetical protein
MTDLAPVLGTPPEERGGSVARAGFARVARFGLGVASFALGVVSSFGVGPVMPLGRIPALADSGVCPRTRNATKNVQRHSVQLRENFMDEKLPAKLSDAQAHHDDLIAYLAARSINSIS